MQPNCVRCKSEEFSYKTIHLGPKYVTLVFCKGCGAVMGVVDSI